MRATDNHHVLARDPNHRCCCSSEKKCRRCWNNPPWRCGTCNFENYGQYDECYAPACTGLRENGAPIRSKSTPATTATIQPDVERRVDPADGGSYDYQSFASQYGPMAAEIWASAKPAEPAANLGAYEVSDLGLPWTGAAYEPSNLPAESHQLAHGHSWPAEKQQVGHRARNVSINQISERPECHLRRRCITWRLLRCRHRPLPRSGLRAHSCR
jgi:hypothetical protein